MIQCNTPASTFSGIPKTVTPNPEDTMTELADALLALLSDVLEYERVNKLYPNPGKQDCWASTTNARSALSRFNAERGSGARELERLKRLVADGIWLKNFVRDHVGMTGHDWDKRHRAERHYADICSLIAAINPEENDE